MIAHRSLFASGRRLTLALATALSCAWAQVPGPLERVLATNAPNGSLRLNSSNRLTVPNDPALEFATDKSFTIETWLRFNEVPATQDIITKTDTFFISQIGNKIQFITVSIAGGASISNEANFVLTEDTWFHLAAVYDATAGETRLHINGGPPSTRPVSAIAGSADDLRIGIGPGGKPLEVEALRIWGVARTQSEINADLDRDLSVFDPVSNLPDPRLPIPGLLAEYRFDDIMAAEAPNLTIGVVPDSSGTGRDATTTVVNPDDLPNALVDGLRFRPPPPLASIPGSALVLPVAGASPLEAPHTSSLAPSDALTVESWLYLDPGSAGDQLVISKGDDWTLKLNDDSRLVFGTGPGSDLTGATVLIPGRWYHLAATWDGVQKAIFLDALPDAVAPFAGPLPSTTSTLRFGADAAGGSALAGRLQMTRLWSEARTALQIERFRWEHTRGFEGTLRGEWRFEADSRDSSSFQNDAASPGNLAFTDGLSFLPPSPPPLADLPPSAGGGALFFPPNSSSAPNFKSSFALPDDPRLDPVEALTIEAWISISSLSDKSQGIVTKGTAWGLLLDPSGHLQFQTRRGDLSESLASTSPLALDRWYHVAAVFDGTNKFLYLDGALDSSAVFTGALEIEEETPALSGDPNGQIVFSGNYLSAAQSMQAPFHGRLDSVRLWSAARPAHQLAAERARELRGTEPGLLGEWRFDHGDLLANSGRMEFPGTMLVGKPNPSTDAPRQISGLAFDHPLDGALALEFNWAAGATDYLALAESPYDFEDLLTAEFWLYVPAVPAPGSSYALLSKGTSAWEVTLESNGKINFHTAGVTLNDLLDEDNQPQAGTPLPDFFSTNRIEPETWYHVAVVWDATGDDGRKEIYLNGQLDNSREDLAGTIALNNRVVLIGARPTNNAGSSVEALLPGALDEVRLWNLAVPGLQIRTAFNNELRGDELGLLGYWPFSEGGLNLDGSETLLTADQHATRLEFADAAFSPGMGILNRIEGAILGAAAEPQYSLAFDGIDDFLEASPDPAFEINTGSLTLEAWVNPAGDGFRNIVMQGDHGYGLAIDAQNRLRYFVDGNSLNALSSTEAVTNGIWQHVAVVVDGVAGTTTFYINGQAAGSVAQAQVIIKPGEPLLIGRQGPFGSNYFEGLLDEVRIWFTARSFSEISFFALQPLTSATLPGLAAYWQFNEALGTVTANRVPGSPEASFPNIDPANPGLLSPESPLWAMGHVFPEGSTGSGLNLSPVAGSEGLWVGTVALDRVNEVQTAIGGESNELSPTADTLQMRLLLHADANGSLHLLKDVIIMRTPPDPSNPGTPRELVLLTDPLLIPQFDGVIERSGKLVGIRYGTVDFDYAGLDLPILGGIGPGVDAAGRISLGRNHPTNPFRHKYHPQHGRGFEITRQFSLSFDTAPADPAGAPPGFGTDWITGTYNETIAGLHKIPLRTAGPFRLRRLNKVATLNGQ